MNIPTTNGAGLVIWLTGLPSSGKSTLADGLEGELAHLGHKVEILDGDEIRKHLGGRLGFSREDREANIRQITYIANLLARNGVVVIVATISPYRSVRNEARCRIKSFVEVHVDCSVEECIRRDVKGLYKRALSGEIQNFTGVSDPYEPPLSPEVVVNTDLETVSQSLRKVVVHLERCLADRSYAWEQDVPERSQH